MDSQLPQCSESHPEFPGQKRRLLPRGKVTTFFDPVIVNEFGICLLCPTLWSGINLIWKDTHGNRDGDVFRLKKGKLVFPIQTRRSDRRVGQPVKRDVVEDVISRQSLRLSVKDAGDERVAARVVVKYPGGQSDG